jgi:hypothetical protein
VNGTAAKKDKAETTGTAGSSPPEEGILPFQIFP